MDVGIGQKRRCKGTQNPEGDNIRGKEVPPSPVQVLRPHTGWGEENASTKKKGGEKSILMAWRKKKERHEPKGNPSPIREGTYRVYYTPGKKNQNPGGSLVKGGQRGKESPAV